METDIRKWEDFNQKEQQHIKKLYQNAVQANDTLQVLVYQMAFGSKVFEENKIKTWDDFLKEFHKGEDWNPKHELSDLFLYGISDKVKRKMIATAKLSKLIEFGYGGMVSEEEWKNEEWYKCVVLPSSQEEFLSLYEEDGFSFIDVRQYQDKQFIAFHTHDQREEFMSYPENVKLVKEYYYDEYRPTK